MSPLSPTLGSHRVDPQLKPFRLAGLTSRHRSFLRAQTPHPRTNDLEAGWTTRLDRFCEVHSNQGRGYWWKADYLVC